MHTHIHTHMHTHTQAHTHKHRGTHTHHTHHKNDVTCFMSFRQCYALHTHTHKWMEMVQKTQSSERTLFADGSDLLGNTVLTTPPPPFSIISIKPSEYKKALRSHWSSLTSLLAPVSPLLSLAVWYSHPESCQSCLQSLRSLSMAGGLTQEKRVINDEDVLN